MDSPWKQAQWKQMGGATNGEAGTIKGSRQPTNVSSIEQLERTINRNLAAATLPTTGSDMAD